MEVGALCKGAVQIPINAHPRGRREMADKFERAKNLLIGAVDTVIALANQQDFPSQAAGPSTSSSSSIRSTSIEEHKRLFGFIPSKGKRPPGRKGKGKRKGATTWKKECICLRHTDQMWKPSSEEKIELARIGLGLAEVVFYSDGDGEHIHSVLLQKCPVFETCGGYTLMRLAENSHNMVEIEGPDSGLSVAYLKDIHAKLFIRPLQKDITEVDILARVV